LSGNTEFTKAWNRIVAKAWADEAYKKRLQASPAAILAEEGVAIPDGMEFELVESTASKTWLVLPAMPTDGDAIEGDERKAAALSLT
jgi:hypothetical protein